MDRANPAMGKIRKSVDGTAGLAERVSLTCSAGGGGGKGGLERYCFICCT